LWKKPNKEGNKTKKAQNAPRRYRELADEPSAGMGFVFVEV
jgi:hypothetical protein